eukprot:2321853-Prymnesium_polylepis.1
MQSLGVFSNTMTVRSMCTARANIKAAASLASAVAQWKLERHGTILRSAAAGVFTMPSSARTTLAAIPPMAAEPAM